MKTKKLSIQQQHDFDSVVQTLQKKEKTQKDLETLFNKISMLDGFNMFIQNYFHGSDIGEQIKLCGDLQYEKKNKGDIIFEQDELSNNKLYIILQGSCYLFLQKDLDFEQDPQQEAHERDNEQTKNEREEEEKRLQHVSVQIIEKMKTIGIRHKRKISLDFEQKNLTQHEISQFRQRYGKTTRQITVGSIFGERAIITSQPRTATIVADSHPTELLVLERDKFLPALEELKRTLQLRRDILFQIFKDMDNYSSARLESMLYSFQVINFSRGQIITEQDQISDKIFIIAEGEAQILKKITIKTVQDDEEEKIARLSIIGPGVMVGDEIMFQSEQKYYYTTEVISIKAAVLIADKKIIDRKFPKDLKDYLKKLSISKEKGRKLLLENKLEEIQYEIQQQHQRQQTKQMKIAQQKKGRNEEETSQSLQKMRDNFAQKYSFSEQTQQQQQQNNFLGQNIGTKKEDISNYSQPSFHMLPQIQEDGSQKDGPQEQDNKFNAVKKKEQAIQQASTFDIKSRVFDFGDGKNIENAERIDKMFKHKNRAVKIHYQAGSNKLASQLDKNKQQIIKKRKEREIFNSMTEISSKMIGQALKTQEEEEEDFIENPSSQKIKSRFLNKITSFSESQLPDLEFIDGPSRPPILFAPQKTSQNVLDVLRVPTNETLKNDKKCYSSQSLRSIQYSNRFIKLDLPHINNTRENQHDKLLLREDVRKGGLAVDERMNNFDQSEILSSQKIFQQTPESLADIRQESLHSGSSTSRTQKPEGILLTPSQQAPIIPKQLSSILNQKRTKPVRNHSTQNLNSLQFMEFKKRQYSQEKIQLQSFDNNNRYQQEILNKDKLKPSNVITTAFQKTMFDLRIAKQNAAIQFIGTNQQKPNSLFLKDQQKRGFRNYQENQLYSEKNNNALDEYFHITSFKRDQNQLFK